MRPPKLLTLCCLLAGLAADWCWADGGVVRAIERDGDLQISVFTSPNPLVAGPVDISVLVQEAVSLAPIKEAQIDVTLTPRRRVYGEVKQEATSAAATNKLFRACLVDLEPGWYDIEVTCDAPHARAQIHFALEVGTGPRPRTALWPWFTWPVVPIVLFSLHLFLSRK